MRRVGGHVSIAGGIQNAISSTINIGGNCLQIFAGSPRLWFRKPFPSDEVEKFLAEKSKNNLDPVFIHALYLVNLASDKEDLVQKSIASLVMDLQNGQAINSAGVVIHIGSHQGRGFEFVQSQLITNIKEIISKTQTTPLLLECDAGQNGKVGSLEELSFLIDNIKDDRLGVCLDTAHLFASGYDLREPEKVTALIKKLKDLSLLDKIKLIHLNDSKTACGSARDMHENLGDGQIGLEGLRDFVNRPELSHLPLILEVPGLDGMGPDKENISRAFSLAA